MLRRSGPEWNVARWVLGGWSLQGEPEIHLLGKVLKWERLLEGLLTLVLLLQGLAYPLSTGCRQR